MQYALMKKYLGREYNFSDRYKQNTLEKEIFKMEIVLNNGFCEMSQNEMLCVDGGIDWDSIGMAICTGAGAYIGGQIGTLFGPVGTVVGVIGGGAAGAAIYTLWD